ncbi:hypothetical protein SBOR_3503 [Sclerotinia borealis F-4128]|uniref:Uncharacterized protein n=1 Tax=Sclerotinia borealis (strain F-4128) TaxID=1432307 RepID=W9CN82_SCLBF|nr:hypothetical protein SBOR_3503 [Sclerotinia borealis F-4128]
MKPRSKSDSYSFVVDKAMEVQEAKEAVRSAKARLFEEAMELKRESERQKEILIQRENMNYWLLKVWTRSFSQLSLFIFATLSITYATCLFIFSCLRRNDIELDLKAIMLEFRAIKFRPVTMPLLKTTLDQQGRHFCEEMSNIAQCYETSGELDITAAIVTLVIALIYILVFLLVANMRFSYEMAKLQGRLDKHEGRLNTKIKSEVQGKSYIENNSHLVLGSIETMRL